MTDFDDMVETECAVGTNDIHLIAPSDDEGEPIDDRANDRSGDGADVDFQAEMGPLDAFVQARFIELRDAVDDRENPPEAASIPDDILTISLLRLQVDFGLSNFERDLVAACLAVETSGYVAELCGQVLGESGPGFVTLAVAQRLFGGYHLDALAMHRPLRHYRLVSFVDTGPISTLPIRLSPAVLFNLAGYYELDPALNNCLLQTLDVSVADLPEPHRASARVLIEYWDQPARFVCPPVTVTGPDHRSLRRFVSACCDELGQSLLLLAGDTLPSDPQALGDLCRRFERDLVLCGARLAVEVRDWTATRARIERWSEQFSLSFALLLPKPVQLDALTGPVLSLEPLDYSGTLSEWRSALSGSESASGETQRLNGTIERVAATFHLDLGQIASAALSYRTPGNQKSHDIGDSDDPAGRLWQACRDVSRPGLGQLAERVDAKATWDDLILAEGQLEQLRDLAAQVRHRATVYYSWGMAKRRSRNLGISALFAGQSGTGKTLAAEVLAAELRLDLYRVELSAIVSKYIGETEKNLQRLFDGAATSGAILFFDEADALFGKRTEVKDSHDRYANIEVSYLLQRMENYRGLSILATNLKSVLDSAFLRRLRYSIRFQFPEREQREQIWRLMFGPAVPTEGLDFGALADLNVAGGNIRNIALNACFLAADDSGSLAMRHVLAAARLEYAKLERPLSASELRRWPR